MNYIVIPQHSNQRHELHVWGQQIGHQQLHSATLQVAHKRHNALSFDCVCKAIASGYIMLTHLPGKFNPADILSKHWGYQTIWPILKPILFFHGDTADLIQDDKLFRYSSYRNYLLRYICNNFLGNRPQADGE